jgi:hypothetical protein
VEGQQREVGEREVEEENSSFCKKLSLALLAMNDSFIHERITLIAQSPLKGLIIVLQRDLDFNISLGEHKHSNHSTWDEKENEGQARCHHLLKIQRKREIQTCLHTH